MNIGDFFHAALPMVVIGLLLAIFFAWRAGKKKKGEKEEESNYGPEGMCLGMCLGTALGSSLWNDSGIGISIGMLAGLVIGSMIHRDGSSPDR